MKLEILCIALLLFHIGAAEIVEEQNSRFREDEIWKSTLKGAVAMRFASNGEVFIAEKAGRVITLDNVNADIGSARTVLDWSDQTFSWHDRGLLSLAVHPQWPAQPYIFVFVSVNRLPSLESVDRVWPSNFECPAANDPYCGTAGRLVRVRVDPNTKAAIEEHVLISDWCTGGASHQIVSCLSRLYNKKTNS